MNTKIENGLIVQIMSCDSITEYEGVNSSQDVMLKHHNKEWNVLDTDRLVKPDHVGKTCKVELLGFLGELSIQSVQRKGIEVVSSHHLKLYAEIVECDTEMGSIPEPHTDIRLLLDVGTGILRAMTVYWPSTTIAGDFSPEDLKSGVYVEYDAGRVDLLSILAQP